MKLGRIMRLLDKYRPLIFSIILIINCFFANGQAVYRPSNTGYFTVSNKPYSPATGIPTDGRTYKADTINGLFRPYNGTTEVKTYLPIGSQFRIGQFPIVVNVGGSLQSNGSFIGGQIQVWWFLRGQADSNLVRMDSATTNLSGFLLAANNLSDVLSASTSRTNLGLGAMALLGTTAGGDLSGSYPSPTVAKFNGQLPSFYLNYNNLFNKPTIPAQFSPIGGTGIFLTGTYPSITINTNAVTTVGPFSSTSFTNGASISSNIIRLGKADTMGPGLVTTDDQTFLGIKSFYSPDPFGGAVLALQNDTSFAGFAYIGSKNTTDTTFASAFIMESAGRGGITLQAFKSPTPLRFETSSFSGGGAWADSIGRWKFGTHNTNIGISAYVHIISSTNMIPSLRMEGGVRPTSPMDGSFYNDNSAHHIYTFLNGTWYQLDQQTGGSGIGVDTIYRTIGKDSIQFKINGSYHSILDSAGSGLPLSANNGVSISGDFIQLGQSLGALGDPALLSGFREIPIDNSTSSGIVLTPRNGLSNTGVLLNTTSMSIEGKVLSGFPASVILNDSANSINGGLKIDTDSTLSLNVGSGIISLFANTGDLSIGATSSDNTNALQVQGNSWIRDTLKTPNIHLVTLDTTNYKIDVVNSVGNHFKTNWPVSSGGTVTGADNGLTNVSGIVKLGGTMTQYRTTIDMTPDSSRIFFKIFPKITHDSSKIPQIWLGTADSLLPWQNTIDNEFYQQDANLILTKEGSAPFNEKINFFSMANVDDKLYRSDGRYKNGWLFQNYDPIPGYHASYETHYSNVGPYADDHTLRLYAQGNEGDTKAVYRWQFFDYDSINITGNQVPINGTTLFQAVLGHDMIDYGSNSLFTISMNRNFIIGGQRDTVRKKLQVHGTMWATDTLTLPNIKSKVFDSTNYKLSVVDASGNFFKMAWQPAIVSASNGLTASAGNVKAGGLLTNDTKIDFTSTPYQWWFKTATKTLSDTLKSGQLIIGDTNRIKNFTGSYSNNTTIQSDAALLISKTLHSNNGNVHLFAMTTGDAPGANGWAFENFSGTTDGFVTPRMVTYSNAGSGGSGYEHRLLARSQGSVAYSLQLGDYDSLNNVSGSSVGYRITNNTPLYVITNGFVAPIADTLVYISGTEKFMVGTSTPNTANSKAQIKGDLYISDSLLLGTVHTGNSTMPVLVYNTTTKCVDTVAQSSIGGGGSSGNFVGRDSVVTITAGSSSTVTDGYNIVQFNPSSVLGSYTLTLPTNWHTNNDVVVVFGGTITSGNPVVTLTVNAGSGQTAVFNVAISGTSFNSGSALRFHKINSQVYDYRIN